MKSKQSYILNRSIQAMLIAAMLLFIAAVFGNVNTYAATEIARGKCQGVDWTVTDDGAGTVKLTLTGASSWGDAPVIGTPSEPPKPIEEATYNVSTPNSRPSIVARSQEAVEQWDWLKDSTLRDSITDIEVTGRIKAQGRLKCIFANMPELVSINGLENIDTSGVHTMDRLFCAEQVDASYNWIYPGCPKLTTIQGIEKWDMSNVMSIFAMFREVSGLKNINLSKWNTPKLQSANCVFEGCENLESIKLNSNFCNENTKEISYLFSGCTNLKTIEGLDSFDTRNVNTMACMFHDCSAIKSLDLSSFKTDELHYINAMFKNCASSLSLTLGDGFIIDNVTEMPGAFVGCPDVAKQIFNIQNQNFSTKNLTNFQDFFRGWKAEDILNFLPKLDTSAATMMARMFMDCTDLTSEQLNQILPKLTMDNVTDISGMFRGCTALTSIDLSKLKTSNVTTMRDLFYGCTSLEKIDLSVANFDTSKVTDMGGMFIECTNLGLNGGGIIFGNNFDTSKVTDMYKMFYKCKNLKSLDLTSFDTGNVKNMAHMFAGCHNLGVDDGGITLGNKFDTHNATIMSFMFQNCENLPNLDFGKKFDTSKVTEMQYMFDNCSGLKSLDLGDKFDTSNVTLMNHMFRNCSGLTSLALGDKFDTGKVTRMESMFYKCSDLKSLDLGDKFDTSNVTNMRDLFLGCASLEKIDLSVGNFGTSKVTDMGGMFAECTNLGLNGGGIIFGNNFDTSKVTDMYKMFYKCGNLESLDLTNFDTSSVTNMVYMFMNCTKLKSAGMLGFELDNVDKADEMLNGCSALLAGLDNEITTVGSDTANYVSGTAGKLTDAKTKLDALLTANPALSGTDLIDALKAISNDYVWKTAQDNVKNAAKAIDTAENAENVAQAARAKADKTGDAADIKAAQAAARKADSAVSYAVNQKALADRNIARAKLTDTSNELEGKEDEIDPGNKLDDIVDNSEERHEREAAEEKAQEAADTAQGVVNTAAEKTTAAKEAAEAVKDGETVEDLTKAKGALASVESELDKLNEQKASLTEKLENAQPGTNEERILKAALDAVNNQIAEAETAKGDIEAIIAGIAGKIDAIGVAAAAEQTVTDIAASTQKAKEDADKVKDGSTQADIDAANKALETANADLNKLKETKAGLEALLASAQPGSAAEAALKDAIAKVDAQIKEAEGTVSHITAISKAIKDRIDAANIQPGETFTVAKQNYVVLTVPENGNPEVALVKAKNAKNVTVPKTVAYKGKTCDVTKINKKAFYKKTKKVTVGANVDTIAKQAFKGSKVATVVLKTKDLTKKSVKGSLKGSKVKTVQVKVGSKKVNKKYVKKYKKIFTKKNAGKKVTVK